VELERPTFHEGQVLAAADLTATVEHSRGHDARHDRYLHDWGIAEGLNLTEVPRRDANNNPYVDVTLEPGTARDGTGLEIVVATPVRLSEVLFDQVNGASLVPDAYYPVVLHGLDRDAPQPAFSETGCGGNGQPKRVREAFEVTFGRVGYERRLDQQAVPEIAAGPGPAGGSPWDVLVGFVQWDPTIERFTKSAHEAGGVRRRYTGVRADRVVARGGRLELRPDPAVQAGNAAVVVGGDPAALVFGVYKGDGSVDERFSVNAKGDVTATGTIKGTLVTGDVRVQSGAASDGVVLPLPDGITEEQVRDGTVTLQLHLTPHLPPSAPSLAGDLGHSPLACSVDDDRRVHCLVRWFEIGTSNSEDVPSACDYLILATRPPSSGAGP
jgi:hypothetical protein